MEKYIVLCGQIVGGNGIPFDTVYGFDGQRFDNRSRAILHGLEIRGSDDFNIGVLVKGKLARLDWMNEPVESDPVEIRRVAEQIGIAAA